ncbi:MAG: multidrug ABC transporter permease [Alphaproteobacteria bacterium]|nr:multidrug ABC transporter permease [Alphaproteobacteria bacterium]
MNKLSPPSATKPRGFAPPRRVGVVNWIGLGTLIRREVNRFLKVFSQTIAAPVITSLLYLAVFILALGGNVPQVGGVSFAEFIAPGLVMMTMLTQAFANTSSSLMIAKMQGNIIDVLMPPLSEVELALAYSAGGVIRGLVVGLATALAVWPFVPFGLANPLLVLFHAVAGCLMMALVGIFSGIWAEKFDHIAAVTNFVIMPLSFLSGTFYSITRLPEPLQVVAHFDPFFFAIDGFRAGFLGHGDVAPWIGIVVLVSINLILFWLCLRLFASGYRLKA